MKRHFFEHFAFGDRAEERERFYDRSPRSEFDSERGVAHFEEDFGRRHRYGRRDPREGEDIPHFGAASRRGEFEGRSERRGRHGYGRGFGGHGPGDFGGLNRFERGRGRMFDAGDLKIVVMKLLSEQPSYGYQLIKTMEQRFAGGYTPSAGVIYPTLTLLEEEGLTAVSTEDGKKVYSVTPEGEKYLEENKERVDELFSRIDQAGRSFERERSPELIKAFMNLRGSVIARVSRGNATKEQIRKIVDAINAAAKTIDEF